MLIKDILFGENNTLMLSREMSLGIVQSKNKALYEDPGSVINFKSIKKRSFKTTNFS